MCSSGNGIRSSATIVGRIDIRQLSVCFRGDQNIEAIRDLSFDVKPGEFVCVLGTTGCGKSTILNVIAGFVPPSSGSVLVNEIPVRSPGSDRGMVFQRHALFPWKTVRKNIEFGLRMNGVPKEARVERANQLMALVGLTGFEDRYPSELSGGMEQRVGLVRTLAVDPLVLLMDEPFGSLDAQTRMMMQELLLEVWDETDKTVLFVTHDVEEAVLLADRIIVLTARPARLKAEIVVSLPRPRGYDIVTSPEFVKIKQQALELIREESFKAIHGSA